MPVVDGREYRNIAITNFTALEPSEDGSMVVEGYATTFDDPYAFRGGYEVISRDALASADMSDIIFQFDHQGMVLARQRNGTLQVNCDDHGLHVRADLSKSQQGRDLYEGIRNGLVDRMSWGFIVADDGWDYDRDTRTSTVRKVEKVFDVSAVSIPANEGTSIHQARSYFDGVIEQGEQELLQRKQEAERRRRLALSLSL